MDKEKRKVLKEQYKNQKTYMGIIQIENTVNGKIFIDTAVNTKNRWYAIKMQLELGRHVNKNLQNDWNEMSEDCFEYSVLEEKECSDSSDRKSELQKIFKQWLEKLKPYGDRGYNKNNTES